MKILTEQEMFELEADLRELVDRPDIDLEGEEYIAHCASRQVCEDILERYFATFM